MADICSRTTRRDCQHKRPSWLQDVIAEEEKKLGRILNKLNQ